MYKSDGVLNDIINLGSAFFFFNYFLNFFLKVLRDETGMKTTYNCAINKLQASRGNIWSRGEY